MSRTLSPASPRILRTEGEYEETLREVERLLDCDPAPGTPEYDRLELLSLLLDEYEEREHAVGPVSPQEAVRFMLEQKGWARSQLDPLMGGASRVSEFLQGKRDLSKAQIVALHRALGIPTDVLLGVAE